MARPMSEVGISHVAAIESRGFIFGAAIALELGAAFVPVRKVGKLPGRCMAESYALEYRTDTLEIHEDALHASTHADALVAPIHAGAVVAPIHEDELHPRIDAPVHTLGEVGTPIDARVTAHTLDAPGSARARTAKPSVLVVDDVLATGGTAAAACRLIERAGGMVQAVCVLIELSFLNGREELRGKKIISIAVY